MLARSSPRRVSAAFPADTRHLKAHERRAYLRLLAVARRRPLPSLPDDDARLDRGFGKPKRKAENKASADVPLEITRIIVGPGEGDVAGSRSW